MSGVLSTLSVIAVVLLGTVLISGLLYLGWRLAIHDLRRQRQGLRAERDLLDAAWRALDDTRRVREVFLVARRAMQREATRQYHRGEQPERPS